MIVCQPRPQGDAAALRGASGARAVPGCSALGLILSASSWTQPPRCPSCTAANAPLAPWECGWAAVTLQGHLSPGHGGVLPRSVLEVRDVGTVRGHSWGSQSPCPALFGFSAHPSSPPGNLQVMARGDVHRNAGTSWSWQAPKTPKSEAQKNPLKNLQTFLCDLTSLSVPSPPGKKHPKSFLPVPGGMP